MTSKFDYFIILAGMRTGSNFLEANLNALDGVVCHGEAFNPHFIGYPNRTKLLGIDRAARDRNPDALIDQIVASEDKLGGFRFFSDHDPRVLEQALNNPRCAKIILTRNPLDSYVSLKIARQTGQWKLTNVKRRRAALAEFDAAEFASYFERLQQFRHTVTHQLQCTGQNAFCLDYDDLRDIGVLNGLAMWLGADGRLTTLNRNLKPQNPGPVAAKVANVDEMKRAISDLDPFNLDHTPNFEPSRGPAAQHYVAGISTPLLYQPLPGGPDARIARWMAQLDDAAQADLPTAMNQKQVRRWMREHPSHRRFTVLRHPLARVHSVFCHRILQTGPGAFLKIRNTLRKEYKLPVPAKGPDQFYTAASHRQAFVAFLEFLRLNLAGQTPIRIDGAWSSQSKALSGLSEFAAPDHVFREDEVVTALPALARHVGHANPPTPEFDTRDLPISLDQIYDPELEQLAEQIYRKDYLLFGFGPRGSV